MSCPRGKCPRGEMSGGRPGGETGGGKCPGGEVLIPGRPYSGVPRGGQGGMAPGRKPWRGPPAQLVGANFKSRGEFQPSKSGFFCLSIFSPGRNANSGGGGGNHRPPGAGDPRHATVP